MSDQDLNIVTQSSNQGATSGPYGVKPIKMNRDIRRGLTLIQGILLKDFDNNFERLFPDITDAQAVELSAAMEWLDQYVDELLE